MTARPAQYVGLIAKVNRGGDATADPALLPDKLADNGEPVIPCFPGGLASRFLGVKSCGYAFEAVIARLGDDPDELLELLSQTYPGLPRAYLADILVATLAAAARLDGQGTYRVFVTPTAATLQNVKTDELHPIWTDLDTKKYL